MEETISLREIFEVLKKRIWMILAVTAGAAIISAIVTFFILTPTYEASSEFIVNQSESMEQDSAYDVNDIRTNVELISTYNVIIKSPAILDEVIDSLNLQLSAEQLSNKIQVSSAEESQVVNVTVTDESQSTAVEIANGTVETFQQEIPSLMNVDNVNILSPAVERVDASPVSPKPLLNIAIAIVVGLMVGVGLAFLLEYLDNTIKTEQDVEKTLGVPLMGVISTISEEDLGPETMNRQPSRASKVRGESVGT
ncbi:capsular polysaccharide biosynthesis protein [Halobacillus andaensis]|uniref:Capsular polysaccharide biosynthesis protein n=1 Tax=Halobacillus andaensis TaxID=1176239 RepID=A0A917BAI6_HALAA|nr:Wzz/FepE/Etk N-terminal domain-containing protein [Halobacillus andaensis]MBP2005394.1 capsular polysaccharide biosynthesis protein [Halobacillus andaensis]GGF31136.1 capsular polysaccharide biosynthesis protein [Halobacillus andaensis]